MIYANEIDKHAAHWLTCLPIKIDHVDSRSIADVKGTDLNGYRQCHFFAGIAGWPLALEMAGWPTDAPVWTGSCPCQPFSAAGKRKGVDDERHLWPEFARLIDECRPSTVFGEQVASKDGRAWLAAVRADLEAMGYAVGAADLCAAGVGAPHIRQRLFWVAHAKDCWPGRIDRVLGAEEIDRVREVSRKGIRSNELEPGRIDNGMGHTQGDGRQQGRAEPDWRDAAATDGRMGDANGERLERIKRSTGRGFAGATEAAGDGLGNAESIGHGAEPERRSDREGQAIRRQRIARGSIAGHWFDVEYIPCRDGKARPVKPGLRCLAHGIPGRVAQLRGLGNAIVPQVASEFVAAFMESIGMK